MGMGKKCSSRAFTGTGRGEICPRGDGDGAVTPDGEFPVDILGFESLSNSMRTSQALFGWAFGFGFWPQKLKAQPKGLLLEGAFSEAAAFP